MTTFDKQHQAHFSALIERYQALLAEHNYDWMLIPSGKPIRQYLDDMDYPFKPNPHFKAVLPLTAHPHCHVLIPVSGKPTVIYYQPVDFWHTVPSDPIGVWVEMSNVVTIAEPQQALVHIPKEGRGVLLGHKEGVLDAVSFSAQNPESLVYPLYWQRAYKSDYEVECIFKANQIAAKAHLAARDEFYAGGSEQTINLAYLKSAGVLEQHMPYGNIVALNQNGAILHYTDCQAVAPKKLHSLLIDAGAQFNGYAADITRTYSFAKNDEFADMITAMDEMQLNLIKDMKVGASYVDLHVKTHLEVGRIANQFGFVEMSPEAMLEAGVSSVFFPHGLGHQIGLQVHDVGGHQTNIQGGLTKPPAEHPFLRNTRMMEAGQVLTIEPGLYFIDSLLADLKDSDHAKAINWNKIESFKPFGGIRIEDEVLVTEKGTRNISREAFAELEK